MIVVEKAYKFRMYPNKKQQELINKTFGCCRFVYNKFFKEKVGFPKFKSKKINRFSYKTNFTNGNIMYCGQHIKL
ncbi:helix-turn-helix domain-containing protein, partial [Clostridioides difficile]|uniref:helix-turn-helix domain-containing protein n=1 Tax=Clostridioides difficile TaxID=1496 RepID=UPI0028A59553